MWKVQVRHNADNGERLLLDLDATPQHERRPAVAALPEPAADDRHGLRAVDIVVSRLRRKLEPLPAIKTLRNAGYALALRPHGHG